MYLTDQQINEMAQAVLTTLEVTPLSHTRKCEVAREHAIDEFGVNPNKTAVLLAVKKAGLGWESLTINTKQTIAS